MSELYKQRLEEAKKKLYIHTYVRFYIAFSCFPVADHALSDRSGTSCNVRAGGPLPFEAQARDLS